MTTEYGTRLRQARKSAQLTQAKLSKMTGIPQSTISTAEREGHGSGETPVYARACGVIALWLATGEGEMMNSQPNKPPAGVSIAQDAINLVNNPEYPAIRRVSLKAQAGVSGYAVEYLNDDGPPIVFGSRWYKSNGYHPEKMIALRVAGESMRPKYSDGDLVVINTDNKTPKDGLIYLVSYEGEVTLKRMIREAGEWWLSSDNPDKRRYPRKACNEHCEVIGKVVYHQTDNVDD